MTECQGSIEEFTHNFFSNNDIQQLLVVDSTPSPQSDADNTCIPYDGMDLTDPRNCHVDKDELDIYFPMLDKSKGETFDPSNYLAIDNNVWELFDRNTHADSEPSLQTIDLILSQSVGATLPQNFGNTSSVFQSVDDLETDYKARYKSDYFSQDGKIRPPRYVADRRKNHFISARFALGAKGYLRIDWVTVANDQNIRFSMPYKFQVHNESIDVPDENPTYKRIDTDHSGLMKIYLVLIKSKQSDLTNLQPLQPFPPTPETWNTVHLVKNVRLPSKQLIQHFQLGLSQLAFTYCPPGPDGVTCEPDWSTTIYSTVMTERLDETPKKRPITCPRCSHSFQIMDDAIDEDVQEAGLKRRKT